MSKHMTLKSAFDMHKSKTAQLILTALWMIPLAKTTTKKQKYMTEKSMTDIDVKYNGG